ncbi:MAG: pyridoxamine 5'-phosphate oxidase family protein [Planctomycetota bacterium]
MARKFTELAFTPSVKAAQDVMGVRSSNEALERSPVTFDRLGPSEIQFVEARDGFYQSTVGENGWPYVQFRGGRPGFLKVIDDRTIAYADLRGNRQYISVGNLSADDRVALILMDYARRSRLKIWARAKIVSIDDDPELFEKIAPDPEGNAVVERLVVLSVEAYDWNCPQHITPRFTVEELREYIEPLHERIAELEAELKAKEER